jgi:hypothetical protein
VTNELNELKLLLMEGQKLSGQSSYERRSPNKKAMPALLRARSGLAKYVEASPTDVEGWRLLSLAEECLLNYPAAETSLQKAIHLSLCSADRRDLKKLALLREYKARWNALTLRPEQLALLGKYLESRLAASPCDHSLRLTTDWLKQAGQKDITAVLNGLRGEGGYCDCEVQANVAK